MGGNLFEFINGTFCNGFFLTVHGAGVVKTNNLAGSSNQASKKGSGGGGGVGVHQQPNVLLMKNMKTGD